MDEKPRAKATTKAHREFLLSSIDKIASAMSVGLSDETKVVFLERLSVLSREQIEQATRRTIDEWDKPNMMPPLKFILDRAGNNAKLEAEQGWELAWKLVKRDWYADGIGWVAGSREKLSPAMQYAIRQCGGEQRLAYANDEEFPFIRRDFIQAHERFSLEGGEQTRLTQGEAVGLLDKLKRGELPE